MPQALRMFRRVLERDHRTGWPALAWAAAVLVKAGLALFHVSREVQVISAAPVVALAGGVSLLSVAVPILVLTGSGAPWLGRPVRPALL